MIGHRPLNLPYLKSYFNDLPQFLGLDVARIFNLQVSPLGNDLLRRERSLGVPPSRVSPPLLDRLNIILVHLLFQVEVTHVGRDCVLVDLLCELFRQLCVGMIEGWLKLAMCLSGDCESEQEMGRKE